MPKSLIDYFKEEPEMQQRFVTHAFKENPNIKDLPDFKDALFRAFNTTRGSNATGRINDEETIFLFNSKECRDLLKDNLSEKEYDEIYGEVKRGEFEVQREVPKGMAIKSKQVRVVYTPKKISIKSYNRDGRKVKAYSKGYNRWKPLEIKFLSIRKTQKKLTTHEIIFEYNKHFQKNPRSSSSIKTKLFRT